MGQVNILSITSISYHWRHENTEYIEMLRCFRMFGTFEAERSDVKIVYGLVDQPQFWNPLWHQVLIVITIIVIIVIIVIMVYQQIPTHHIPIRWECVMTIRGHPYIT